MEYLSANAITALLPEMAYELPLFGVLDLRIFILSLSVFLALSFSFWLLRIIVLANLKRLSRLTTTDIDDVVIDAIKGVRPWVYNIIALFLALQFFTLPQLVANLLLAVFLFAVVWQIVEIAVCFVDYGTRRWLEKDEDGDGEIDPNSATASNMVALLARIVLWALGILFVLSNLGIEVTSLIAGLGIGGIAVAFALQGILSDLFASFSLYADKPFRIGDFVVIGNDSGTVQKIGIKSTRLKTLQGEELVVSNSELTTARVQNFKKMDERRIVLTLGVTYDTPYEKVKNINGMIEEIFDKVDGGRLDRVHFTTFADSALLFEVVYYVESSDYTDYLNIQQIFNHNLMKRFADEQIEFAYPTQTIFVKKD
ncbi:mechanosensitive ion channel family protein [Candidatus Kaiserbacteria bacterium]|nr:mechanosensitive ion channel family protein [Candidatus Kaiserbacteria bacterium]